MFLILLTLCTVASAIPPTRSEFNLLKDEVSCLSDSVATLNEIILAHEEYIGSDMAHKREKHEIFQNLAKTDFIQQLILYIVAFLSGGQLISKHPVIRNLIIAWGKSLSKTKKEE